MAPERDGLSIPRFILEVVAMRTTSMDGLLVHNCRNNAA
jgi:hypothetical protein